MSNSKHEKGTSPFAEDLGRNPAIGQSPGTSMTGESPKGLEGETTTEGDFENDSTRNDGVPAEERGRTNS